MANRASNQLTYVSMVQELLRRFRKPHCGSIRIDETYIKVRGRWRCLYRVTVKHGEAVEFMLSVKRNREVAKRFFKKMLEIGQSPYPHKE